MESYTSSYIKKTKNKKTPHFLCIPMVSYYCSYRLVREKPVPYHKY